MTRTTMRLPEPHIHRRRKFTDRKLRKDEKVNKTPFLMVPRFFDMYHPTTTWLINTVASENEKEIDRVLCDKETNNLLKFEPDPLAIQAQRTVMTGNKEFVITKAKYFQILDRPELYSRSSSFAPLFNRHAVLYLTPLGLAIYLRKFRTARQLMECINRDSNRKHVLARQPQFVTCINDPYGDLMCLYDHNIAMLCEAYEIMHCMLMNGNWFPMEPFRLVYRKKFIETNMWFDDFMDYAFYVLLTKRSSMNVARLAEAVLRRPTEHFILTYMAQPSRAMKITLVRDAEKVINNCKTYPRRLLRCAFYADKKLRSTVNLINAAGAFVNGGVFKLSGDPMLPFRPKEGRRKRLEALPPYKARSRKPNVEWPSALYEFDCDCCIALLCGLLSKCYRGNKKTSLEASLKLATKVLADAGWLDYFSSISDQEFKDYFMGLDDAEKLRFQPEIFSFVRECVKITVFENRFELAEFFSDNRLRQDIRDPSDLKNNDILRRMVQCNDATVSQYVELAKGEKLKPAATVIGGPRVRGEGRDDPKNRYYMDRMEFPPESVKTIMTNTANVDSVSSSTTASVIDKSGNNSERFTSDSRRQCLRRFAGVARLVDNKNQNDDEYDDDNDEDDDDVDGADCDPDDDEEAEEEEKEEDREENSSDDEKDEDEEEDSSVECDTPTESRRRIQANPPEATVAATAAAAVSATMADADPIMSLTAPSSAASTATACRHTLPMALRKRKWSTASTHFASAAAAAKWRAAAAVAATGRRRRGP